MPDGFYIETEPINPCYKTAVEIWNRDQSLFEEAKLKEEKQDEIKRH